MITSIQAEQIIKKNLPSGRIQAGPVPYQGKWLFSVYVDDTLEEDLDPFYSVDRFGNFSGFSITADPETFLDLFESHINLVHNSLMHYGVKGMKWGVRKDRKPAANASSLSVTMETGLNVVKPLLTMVVPRANLASRAAMVAVKAALTGKAITTTALAASYASPMAFAGYAVSAADSGAYRVPGVALKNAVRGGWPKNESLADKNLSVSQIQSRVVKGINSQYPGLGTTNNCLRCSYAYEMRRRGYDVSATKTMMASGQKATTQKFMNKSFSSASKVQAQKPTRTGISAKLLGNRPTESDAFSALSKEPNRSRGEFQMSWGPFMGGHSISYEIINNKPVFFDTQSGKTYSSPSQLKALTSRAKKMTYMRLDDKDLNNFALTAWIKDA